MKHALANHGSLFNNIHFAANDSLKRNKTTALLINWRVISYYSLLLNNHKC